MRVVEAVQEQDGRALAFLGPVESHLAQIDLAVLHTSSISTGACGALRFVVSSGVTSL
jgi:hypothetical protein